MRTSLNELEKLHPTTRYAVEVVSGLRPACKREWQACERHLKDLQRQGTDEFPFVFDESRANRIFDWFERCCRHVRGPFAGQLIKLQAFQKFDLGCLFGWVHKDTGRRRFKKSFNMRARGNVKSTEMSGIALYGMCGDCVYPPGHPELKQYEDSPEVECAAVDREQAKRIWLDAKRMGEASPDILKRLRIRRTYVEHQSRGGWLRPLSKDTKNKDSGAPCIVIIDEYHAHPTSDIHDVLYSGFGKRQQSLMCIITTAGKDAENSPCKKEYDICCKILDGALIDETYFVMIRELDKGDDPHDESKWVKANPVLQEDNEYSRILLEQIRAEHNLAYGSGDPDKIREFLTKRCNLWQADSENKYFSGCMDKWKALAVPRGEFLRLVHGRECWCGIDLSKAIDLTAAGFVFRLDDGRYAVTAHGFIPENAATKHEHTDRVPYKAWAQQGWCTLTEGDVTDDEFIKNYIHEKEFDEEWKIKEICFDPYGARQFANDMTKKGYTCVEIPQRRGILSEPTKKFRELTLKGKIVHDGSPLLTWCLSNAVETSDSDGNIKLSKKHKDDSQRIDLMSALINAFVRAMLNEQPKQSVYEERGLRSL
ncbi:terminase large subunit [Moorella sp. E306M]|uniref:terminase large subunit n=1 Tax=Moorella sp. E306M TaxID=2572683 RepID=UPI0010FFC5F0|nr:terminase TerL endonuclease subunit [Moorella sp. E306M]GEA17510.1 terminase [Moorella sp. E306M]